MSEIKGLMKKIIIALSVIMLLTAFMFVYINTIGRYHGEKPGSIGIKYGINKYVDKDDVVKMARKQRGVIYDFSRGKYDNKFSKFGFIVCADLIDIAFSKAGYPLEYEMKNDYRINFDKYQDSPTTGYFFRRTRNIHQFCEDKNFLIRRCKKPEVGDIVFYGQYHVALVTRILDKGRYCQIEALPNQIIVMETEKVWKNNDVGRIDFSKE
jgi:hypothetical protein